jgi:hypothetical protein
MSIVFKAKVPYLIQLKHAPATQNVPWLAAQVGSVMVIPRPGGACLPQPGNQKATGHGCARGLLPVMKYKTDQELGLSLTTAGAPMQLGKQSQRLDLT